MTRYIINTKGLSELECFADASPEELRVLLCLISEEGAVESSEKLAALAHTSKARIKASLAFWQEAGVIAKEMKNSKDESAEGNIKEEYKNTDKPEEPLESIAKKIKDSGLASLLSECARLMDKPMLSTSEAKEIVSVYTKYDLNEEYIITLAAFLKEEKKLSVPRLTRDAEALVKKGIDCLEELEIYLSKAAKQSSADWEYKRLLGIWGRTLSEEESQRAQRWFYTYGYSAEIIGLAYSITTTATGGLEIPYMDKIIAEWYSSGCKTLEDCKMQNEKFKDGHRGESIKSGESQSNRPQRRKQKEKPRYGEFNVADAFSKALERSYGKSDEEN